MTEQPYLAGNILLIPGTSSSEHLRLNLQAAALRIRLDVIADLNANRPSPGTIIAGESEARSLFHIYVMNGP
jgi:hypothetical protein